MARAFRNLDFSTDAEDSSHLPLVHLTVRSRQQLLPAMALAAELWELSTTSPRHRVGAASPPPTQPAAALRCSSSAAGEGLFEDSTSGGWVAASQRRPGCAAFENGAGGGHASVVLVRATGKASRAKARSSCSGALASGQGSMEIQGDTLRGMEGLSLAAELVRQCAAMPVMPDAGFPGMLRAPPRGRGEMMYAAAAPAPAAYRAAKAVVVKRRSSFRRAAADRIQAK